MTDLDRARALARELLDVLGGGVRAAVFPAFMEPRDDDEIETPVKFDLEAELSALIKREGGYVDHPSDKGGPTKYGITEAVARKYGYKGAMQHLPEDTARAIYRKQYWEEPRFFEVATIARRLAAELFDTGVNMGPRVQVVWLQRWLNGLNRRGRDYADIAVDGVIGPATLGALKAFLKVRGGAKGEQALVAAVNCSQGHRYLELAEGRPANEDFLYGWLTTRIVL